MSIIPFPNSSDSSLYFLLNVCFKSRTTIFLFMSFGMTNILLLFPLFFFILYLGFQQWRKERSSSTAATMSHSDFFTYNVIGLELMSIFGSLFNSFAAYVEDPKLQLVGLSICSITSPGQTLFHLLTCVERYLAVVHPIIYLSLKQACGIKIRNISTGCVWLLSFGLVCLGFLSRISISIIMSCLLVLSLVLVSYFSFSVLHVLNHPGPGQVSNERVDQSKHRAFHTIVAIMVALLLRFVGVLVCNNLFNSSELTHTMCALGSSAMWLTLPCSLVLPLLFLQRAGQMPGCKITIKSRQGLDLNNTSQL